MAMWKINAGRRSVLADAFLGREVVAIGWREAGDCTGCGSRETVLARVAAAYPERSERQNEVSANQIWRFLTELKVGDRVITYDPATRLYHLGVLEGGATYDPAAIEELPTQRPVIWQAEVSRDALSASARNKLGAILTLFKVERATAAELEARAGGEAPVANCPAPADGTQEAAREVAVDPLEGLEEQALERIKDKLLALDWSEMQDLVASLLRALGYRTIVSPAGPDRGKDIVASRDGFGFEPPRIVVEVKHRRGQQMGAPEIRAFLGGRHAEDRGLYVSTGGFTREAHFEAERAATVTHLMTLDGLARALVDDYDRLDERGRALLPLTRLYWPS